MVEVRDRIFMGRPQDEKKGNRRGAEAAGGEQGRREEEAEGRERNQRRRPDHPVMQNGPDRETPCLLDPKGPRERRDLWSLHT